MSDDTDLLVIARRTLGLDGREWREFVRTWGDLGSDEDLYRNDPALFRGQRRLLARLLVAGVRAGNLCVVGPDYLVHLVGLRNEAGLSDAELERIAELTGGHPAGLCWPAMSGPTFRAVLRFFRDQGFTVPDLARDWMTPERMRFLDVLRSASGVNDDSFDAMLRDLGGGVSRAADLDEDGFERLQVALELRAGSEAPATRQ